MLNDKNIIIIIIIQWERQFWIVLHSLFVYVS